MVSVSGGSHREDAVDEWQREAKAPGTMLSSKSPLI